MAFANILLSFANDLGFCANLARYCLAVAILACAAASLRVSYRVMACLRYVVVVSLSGFAVPALRLSRVCFVIGGDTAHSNLAE